MEQRAVKFNCRLIPALLPLIPGRSDYRHSERNQWPPTHEYHAFGERNPLLDYESKRFGVALDAAGIEMSSDHQHRFIGETREQIAPGLDRL